MNLTSVGQPSQQSKEQVISQIEKNFNKATYENYVHYVLKHCKSKQIYEISFQSKLEEIIKTTGKSVLLNSKRVNSWTPMHVGAIVNNIEGVKHLLELGVSSEKDDFGKTPYDYCIMFGHNKLALLLEKQISKNPSSDESNDIIKKFIKTWSVNLLDIPFEYKAKTNDFGVEIKKLLFTRENAARKEGLEIQHLANDMKNIAEIEGFELRFTNFHIFPRDFFILQPDNFKLPGYKFEVLPICLEGMDKLMELRISNNAIVIIPDCLTNLKRLKEIHA